MNSKRTGARVQVDFLVEEQEMPLTDATKWSVQTPKIQASKLVMIFATTVLLNLFVVQYATVSGRTIYSSTVVEQHY